MGCLTMAFSAQSAVEYGESPARHSRLKSRVECVRATDGPSDPSRFLKLVEPRGDDLPVGDTIEIARRRQLRNTIGDDRQRILAMMVLERERAGPELPIGKQLWPFRIHHYRMPHLVTVNLSALSGPSRSSTLLGPTLDALRGGEALQGLDTLEMADALAQTYARLDYLHPFREGNSRTLRTFTAQLAREAGHRLDWDTTSVTAQSRDALYIARDVAVIQLRYPGLTADSMMTVDDREHYEMAFQLNRHRLRDPLQELIRRSLERGRDQEPYDRRMTVVEAAREVGVVAPIALNQVDRQAEETRLAVLRRKAPASKHDEAVARRDWVVRKGNVPDLSRSLSQIAGGAVTVRHTPGAPAFDRLDALVGGIDRALAHDRSHAPPVTLIERGEIER
jgi:cell filamentation protein